ncbi:Candidate Outer-membrane lipoprotein lolB precursor [Ramlibacter tataouinensis TTB310]|uniref:Outer-membrane lipoprotein LolB n=1 Tax=Ramlibacter tataouinensis (strain ATCC BAA-407 / DSM 14655 / LMG 21543 / TTB310) TaxID=365046 RepID=F5XYS2_RAMTT|nr:Candidate Outer-membrane lipoprotein lolB precursor [Ramlibacter tataouinensis TTB310]
MAAARTGLAAWGLAAAVLLLAGCAAPLRQGAQDGATASSWSGRLALQVQDDARQSFSAAFELRGRPEAGELRLFNPLGGTAGVLTWSPGRAVLETGGQTRQAASLEELVAQATGSPIPVTALFDWLAGIDTPVPGWKADLEQLAQGRIRAQRLAPPPLADLRVVLDR